MSEPDFEPPPKKRPLWAWLVLGVYGVLAATILLAPLGIGFFGGGLESFVVTFLISGLVFVCGASLFLIPVPKGRPGRVVTRRSIWCPVIGSSLLAALLCVGFTAALDEFLFDGPGDRIEGLDSGTFILVPLLVVWLGWLILFGTIALSRGPEAIGNKLWQALLVGSAAELLIAVPMHLVVRQRTQCCAGLATGFGIAVGALLLFIALGPAVFVLCYRRYQQVYSRDRDTGGG